MTPYVTEYEAETLQEQTTRTYRIDTEAGRVSGYTDGLSAMEQAVLLILNTQRFRHGIYSWGYGSEVHRVMGEDFQLAKSEVRRYITEALTQDERITGVEDFAFAEKGRNTLSVSFTVRTIFGDISEQTEVAV